MGALIIGETERAAIAELRAVAAATPFDVDGTAKAFAADVDGFRDAMRVQTLVLPIGYQVTYTQEIQPNAPPPGLCHHISISVERPNGLPSPAAVELILHEFGMRSMSESQDIWLEDIEPGEKAVNVIQLIA